MLLRAFILVGACTAAWLQAAVLTSVTPTLGDVHGGVPLTIRGSGFVKGATGVLIGDAPCTDVVVVNAYSITCLSPERPEGMHAVSVSTPSGTATKAAAYEAWSPISLPSARVYQADQGVMAVETTAASWHPWTRKAATLSPYFRQRDGAQLLYLNQALYLLGGWKPVGWLGKDTTNEVWKSVNGGATWSLILPHNDTVDWQTGPRWRRRHMHAVTVHKGLLYVIGGDTADEKWPTYPTDVWSSPDGVKWTRRTNNAEWGPRVLHMAVSLNNKLYVMGGQTDVYDDKTAMNDVWESADDGVTWTQVTANAAWPARGMVTSPVVFHGQVYLCGGGTYVDTSPRAFYNDVWRWSGSGAWELVTAEAAFPGRQYHSVEVFADRLWVMGGYNPRHGNMNDVWSSPDGVTWTENKNTPWDGSHADGVAAGGGFLFHTPGNGSMGPPYRRDVWQLSMRPGLAVSGWNDLGAAGKHLGQAEADLQPFLFPNVFGKQPGIEWMGVHYLHLPEVDRGIAAGVLQVYAVIKTTNKDLVADMAPINPPATIIGNTTSETHNQFGIRGGQLSYCDGGGGWRQVNRGGGYNDGRCRLLWVQHQNKSLRMGSGSYASGATDVRVGFSTDYTGWNAVGAGYGAADRGQFALGALVVIPGPVLAPAQIKKLSLWARKWGSISP
ncbi:MAG: IPT/TIG domain-containing protein [Verrucomicrobiota bacterium]